MAKTYRELIVWQLADELRREVYRLIDTSPASNDFQFAGQLRGAVAGIGANVADGFPRSSPIDFARLATYSMTCLTETEERLGDGIERHFWTADELVCARRLIRRLTPALRRFIRYLRSQVAAERSRNFQRRRLNSEDRQNRQNGQNP